MKQNLILIKKHSKFLFFSWLLIIIIVSSIPQFPTPKIKAFDSMLRVDYLFHIIEYLILAFFFILWMTVDKSKLKFKNILLYIALGMGIAFFTELYQTLIPGRKFNILDSLYKAIGFVTVTLFFYLKSKGKKSKIINP